jgi:hypothetical protein
LESALVKQRPLHGVENRLGSNTTTCTYGPADAGCQWIYFLEDLNLPMVDTHGKTQPAVALVRQWLDYQHWHDTITFAQKKFVDCQFIVSMNPTAGSHTINPRLQRHLITLALGVPPETRYVMRLFRISIERGVVRISILTWCLVYSRCIKRFSMATSVISMTRSSASRAIYSKVYLDAMKRMMIDVYSVPRS